MQQKILDRFWAKVARGDDTACWNWLAAKTQRNYGMFWPYPTNTVLAHRFAWLITNGEIPNAMYVLHHCDNPSCVNPRHLFLGTQFDNMQDAKNKKHLGGNTKHRPIENLTDKSKAMIRFLYKSGCYTMLEIAQLARVSESYISLIVSKRR